MLAVLQFSVAFTVAHTSASETPASVASYLRQNNHISRQNLARTISSNHIFLVDSFQSIC